MIKSFAVYCSVHIALFLKALPPVCNTFAKKSKLRADDIHYLISDIVQEAHHWLIKLERFELTKFCK